MEGPALCVCMCVVEGSIESCSLTVAMRKPHISIAIWQLCLLCVLQQVLYVCLSCDVTTSKNNKAVDCYMYVRTAMVANDVLHESVDLKCVSCEQGRRQQPKSEEV